MSQGFDEVSCTNVTCTEGGEKKVEQRKKVPEQHSFGSSAGRVGAFLMF